MVRKYATELPGRTMSNRDARRHVNEEAVSDRLTGLLKRRHKAVSALPAVTTGNGGGPPSPPRGGGTLPQNGCRETSDIITCQDCQVLPPWQLCPACTELYMQGLTE